MKKILIISDNHGVDQLNEILNLENCDYNIHLGDSQFQYDGKELENFDFKVRGNCDFSKKFPQEIEIEFTQIGKILVTHGDHRNVKITKDDITEYGVENNINLILYGHTHELYLDYLKENDLLIINPGSFGFSRSHYPNTYVVLEYSEGKYNIKIKDAGTTKIVEERLITRS